MNTSTVQIEKAKKSTLKLSTKDALLFIYVLNNPLANPKLKKAIQNYIMSPIVKTT